MTATQTLEPSPDADARGLRYTLSWIDFERRYVSRTLCAEAGRHVFGRETDDRIRDPTVGRRHFAVEWVSPLCWSLENLTALNGLTLRRPGQIGERAVTGQVMLY